jgi:transposase
MGSTRRAFTPEYKEQSVAFVIDGGRPVAEVARNIGVHEMTLGKWVKVAREAAESGKNPDAPLGESERAELVRLRGESRDDKSTIAELRMQVEFAKKVATWFAKGSQ